MTILRWQTKLRALLVCMSSTKVHANASETRARGGDCAPSQRPRKGRPFPVSMVVSVGRSVVEERLKRVDESSASAAEQDIERGEAGSREEGRREVS